MKLSRISSDSSVRVVAVLGDADQSLHKVLKALRRTARRDPLTLLAVVSSPGLATPRDLAQLLDEHRLPATFTGWLPPDDPEGAQTTLLAIIEADGPQVVSPPPTFRVAAIMRTFNEEDIISESIEHLIAQGCEVYILDGWSTDRTVDRAKAWLGRGLVAIEQFPPEGPIPYFPILALLRRVERLAAEIETDWFIHVDADELRTSPWPGTTLREALFQVDQRGFNCIDHTVIEFPPTGVARDPARPVTDDLTRFVFSVDRSHFVQRKAWKKQPRRVQLAASAGHDVTFPGRRVYPFKFLLRHYPVRSQEHGERKLYRERRDRLNPFEAARNWSIHYRRLPPSTQFVLDPEVLEPYEETCFNERYLVERLSGIGAYRRRLGSAPAATPVLHWESRTLPWSRAVLRAVAVRPPNLDPAALDLGAVTIDWNTRDRSHAALFVARGQGQEQLFDQGPSGHSEAPWIEAGIPYRFRLFSDIHRAALHGELKLVWSP
jgi:glycosyltransferase involved in cell wall biosynthesis